MTEFNDAVTKAFDNMIKEGLRQAEKNLFVPNNALKAWLPEKYEQYFGVDRRPIIGPHKIKRTWKERLRSNPFQKHKDIPRLP